MRSLVIFGKGGIGKSTLASNLAALWVAGGRRVLQVGCDPKRDSCRRHLGQPPARTLMDDLEKGTLKRSQEWLESHVLTAANGVACLESGGPRPGTGCAGRAVSVTIQLLADFPAVARSYDIVLFDVLGDVVCGGFASPVRSGMADLALAVVAGETMSLHAANNILLGLNSVTRGRSSLNGLVLNERLTPGEGELVAEFSRAVGLPLLGTIPRDPHVMMAELEDRNVIERFPGSPAAVALSELAGRISGMFGNDLPAGRPLEPEALQSMCRTHLGRIMRQV